MKNARMKRAVGLLVVVNITGEREYSYKVLVFAQMTGCVWAIENPGIGWHVIYLVGHA